MNLRYWPLRSKIHHIPAPRCKSCSTNSCSANCCIKGLEQLLEEKGDQIAALFFESQQGEGGYFPLPPETGKRLRELTQKHGILLIADEIQAGMGRTGKWFGFEHMGITPDIIVFGKAIGGGLPLAGLIAPQPLLEKWEHGEHGTTFG